MVHGKGAKQGSGYAQGFECLDSSMLKMIKGESPTHAFLSLNILLAEDKQARLSTENLIIRLKTIFSLSLFSNK